ncbi:F-box protein KIB4-like [Tripterygium wilfordii]|uniref:F-box protein KIB4-like n=1 Tax=Tripterygium wilfordii TaxID=458696 RepID=UPI0018F83EC1|nr:F-box protein KIB4-like [Tripterygium wilfordii]
MSMADWTQLPHDILWTNILCKLSVVDHYRLSLVCKSWRSVTVEYINGYPSPGAPPCLMVPGTDILRDTNCKTRRILVSPVLLPPNNNHIPKVGVPHVDLCRGSYQGWLVMINNDMDMYLLNPFSRKRIDLPSVMTLEMPCPRDRFMCKWQISKAFLSTTPTNSNCCFVMVIHEGFREFAYCKVGHTTWRPINGPDLTGKPYSVSTSAYWDAIYLKGKFYVIAGTKVIYVCDLAAIEPTMIEYCSGPEPSPNSSQMYLVESGGGELLLIFRISTRHYDLIDDELECVEVHLRRAANKSTVKRIEIPSKHSRYEDVIDTYDYENNFLLQYHNHRFVTQYFEVYKLDTRSKSEPSWTELEESLDGESLFVGLNQSFSISNPRLFGYKENQIYFTDNALTTHQIFCYSGNDMGVFDLKECTVESLDMRHFKYTTPPPIWVIPKP